MTNVGRSIAKGAAWMVLFKAVERSIGVVSTLILARLLVPADFGLIAMAMSFVALLELLWSFSFDSALIQKRDADRSLYDTAWTLNACLGLSIATGLVLLAHPVAWFYEDQRLAPILYYLAFGTLLQGIENIGVVAFRKELRFGMEFGYQVAKKIVGFCVTIPVAFALQSYWALIIGILAGRAFTVLLSYVAHPYRPRFSLAARNELLHFSKWLFFNNLLFVLQMRSQDFVIGKVAGPAGLGLYTVAHEISTLPTSELVAPVNRAVFPGFAKLAADIDALRSGYLNVFGLTALLVIPAGLGIAATASLLVPTVLGAKWMDAVPIIQVLALYGALAALSSMFQPTFLALGRTQVLFNLTVANLILFIPSVIYGAINLGVMGAAWACLSVVSIMMPVSHVIACRALHLSIMSIIGRLWRPMLAGMAMFAAVSPLVARVEAYQSSFQLLPWLLAAVAFGAFVYLSLLAFIWLMAGRPIGAESLLLNELSSRLRKRRESAS
jgi:O-antigen/teichoic acid export membrane protein